MNRRVILTLAVLAVIVLGLISPQLMERIVDRSGTGDTITVEPIADLSAVENLPVVLFDRIRTGDFTSADLETGRNYSHDTAAQHAAILATGFAERCGLPVKREAPYQPEAWSAEPILAVSADAEHAGWSAVIWDCICTDEAGLRTAGLAFDDAAGAPMGIFWLVREQVLREDPDGRCDEAVAVFADMMGATLISEWEPDKSAQDELNTDDVVWRQEYVIGDSQEHSTVLSVIWRYAESDPETGEPLYLLTVGWPE